MASEGKTDQLHLMVDFETLDTRPTAVVLSAGLVVFNSEKIVFEKEIKLDINSQLRSGRTVSASTLQWWSKQGGKFTKELEAKGQPISDLTAIVSNIFSKNEGCKIWGNGSTFDVSIMSNIYESRHLDVPWKFWNEVCYRTFVYAHAIPKTVNPNAHNALSDAKHQALTLINWAKKAGHKW